MFTLDAALATALAQHGHVAVARLTVLEPDLVTVRRTFDLGRRIVQDGSVTAELRRDVRRYASLTLVNADGTLSPALTDDLFAAGTPMLIERGALVSGVANYAPLLAGFVTGCVPDMRGRIALTAESYMGQLRQDMGSALVLPAGTFLVAALHTLIDPVLPTVTWLVDDAAAERAIGADIPVLATDDRLGTVLAMADALGVDVYDDRSGRINVVPRPDRATQAAVRVMREPLSLSRTIGRLPVNAQGVEASPGTGAPFYVLVEVDDPASPVHRDRIGLRVAPVIRSDAIPDPDTARALGRSVLAERAFAQDTLAVENLPVHLDLDPGDVVERTEALTGTGGRYVIDAVSIPVGPGTISTTEVTSGVLFAATI